MNDLERDLRTLLDEKASTAGAPMPDAGLLRRAKRRQVGTVVGGTLAALAIVAGAVVAVSALGPSDRRMPTEPSGPLVETTVNGITIEHPESWNVVDPVGAGIEQGSNDLPRLVLVLSTADPVTIDSVACPALTEGTTGGVLMTIQQEPLALVGDAARSWPAELQPLGTTGDLAGIDLDTSPCYAGWTFLRAAWTAGGRTFEATAGYGPDASEATRQALRAAFASMRFESTGSEPAAVVIATGTAGGEDWELIATNQGEGLELGLEWSTGGSGFSVEGPDDRLTFDVMQLGDGADREVVVYGLARPPIVRFEYLPVDDLPGVSLPVIDIPDALDDGYDAFVFTYPAALFEGKIRGLDADGRVVEAAAVLPPPDDGGEPVTAEGTEIARGDGWYLLIDDRSGLCLTMLTGDGSEGSCSDTDEFWDADAITVQGRSVVYGLVPPETARVTLQLQDGTTHEATIYARPDGFAYEVAGFAMELDGTSGTGRLSLLDDTGAELGSADIEWAPGSSDVVFER